MTRWLCLLLFVSPLLHAEDQIIQWNGEVRVRGEFDGRDFSNKSAPLLYTLLRTRIGARIAPTTDMRIVLQLQDARYFGQEGSGASATTANSKNVDLYQGYVQTDNLIVEGLSSLVGRIALSYGNERFVGQGTWANTGRSFDALVFRYTWGKESIDLFSSNVVETQTPPLSATPASVAPMGDEGLLFSGLFASSRTYEAFGADMFLLHEWNRKQTLPEYSDLSRFTAGARLFGMIDGVTYEGEGALQFGNISRTDIQAFFLAGKAGYSWDSFGVTAGFEFLSGTPLGSVKFKSFEPVYHTGHKFYGFMDYFVNIPLNTQERGLQNLYVRGSLKLSEGSSITVTVHDFALTESLDNRKRLGQEVDAIAAVQYNSHLSFEGGIACFVPDEIMRARFGGADVAWWGYLTTRAWF